MLLHSSLNQRGKNLTETWKRGWYFLLGCWCAFIALSSLYDYILDNASQEWPVVQGVIVGHGACDTLIQCGPLYRYVVNNKTYFGNRVSFQKSRYKIIARLYEDYPVGKAVMVHYAEKSPVQSTLEVAVADRLMLILVLMFFCISLSLFWEAKKSIGRLYKNQ